jgi:MoxR-like ATPase
MNKPETPPEQTGELTQFDDLAARFAAAANEVERSVIGQDEVVEQVFVTLLAGGHALIVGLPGLAKTRLVKAVGTALGLDTSRVQFTPDLVPADILGAEVLETAADGARAFRFVQGPIFAQLLMADEINRASPRTQSALLEAMQERQVTTSGAERPLPAPFHVLATQNPIEQEGTYPLPEAQLDRFLFRIDIDFPAEADERRMLLMTTGVDDAVTVARASPADLLAAQDLLRQMPVADDLVDAALSAVRSLRPAAQRDLLDWGPGPRAGQALIAAARSRAFLHRRASPIVEDLAAVLAPALRHRIAIGYAGRREGLTVDGLLADAVAAL